MAQRKADDLLHATLLFAGGAACLWWLYKRHTKAITSRAVVQFEPSEAPESDDEFANFIESIPELTETPAPEVVPTPASPQVHSVVTPRSPLPVSVVTPVTPKSKVVRKVHRPVREAAPKTQENQPGITVRDGKLHIADWNAWMKEAPRLISIATDAGAKSATDVLKVVFNQVLPQYAWPPEPGSRFDAQWQTLVGVVASALKLPELPPDNDDEMMPKLYLVR